LGLNSRFLQDLVSLKRRGISESFNKVVEIGAQQLSNDFLRADGLLDEIYLAYGQQRPILGQPIDEGFVSGIEHQSERNPSSRFFWSSLGFRYTSLEFDGHRDSVPIDLNKDVVPAPMRETFDLIINTGTTEHVANQDNAFRVIHDLCKVGGVMYHELPAGGMMTHGLITYTPKFFWHLCRENDYRPISLRMISCGTNPVPANIRASNVQFAGEDPITADNVTDFLIVAVLSKQHDKPFRTPLDVPVELMPA
jgi:SAM-dependent methyltransferase